MNNYQETSNNGDDFKPYVNPGISAQYNLHSGKENLMNHLSLGFDYQSMRMTEHMFAVPDGDHINNNRVDSYWSEEVFDLDKMLISQVIRQRSAGLYLIDKLDISKKLYATLNLRYDNVYNQLDSSTISDSRSFQKPTWRLGLAYDLSRAANIYASFGTGFLVPTEDELYNNPDKYGGFNTKINPSTSIGGELGVRGDLGIFCKNMFDEQYFGFTEPNNGPDYNSYQAAPGREFFVNLRLRL